VIRAGLACLVAVGAAACTTRDTIATQGGRPGEDVGRDEYCAGSGPPVLIGGSCTGDIAEEIFRHALCGCSSLQFGSELVTDGYDSRVAPYAAGGLGGDVASNVGLDGNRAIDIGGNVTISGAEGVEAGDRLDIAGDLECGGLLGRSSSAIGVDGSARVAGNIDVASLRVGGTLTTSPAATLTAPCACDGIDVAAVVADHRAANHDAAIGLAPDQLANVAGDATLELPCGRFYLDRIQGNGPGTLTIAATGRTALFVGGNVTIGQSLVLDVRPGAELDLFVDGTLQVSGAVRLGDAAQPRALRIYVAAGGSLSLAGGSVVAGNLWAPRADLAAAGPLEVFGSLVVNRINSAAQVVLHYDRAVAFASDGCSVD
jgi:hypothetical protein